MKLFFLSIAAITCCHVFAQSFDNNWTFGDSIGLNFITDPPSVFNSVAETYEACATISDSSGNLLFYTNGETVWNRDHEIMENGEDLEIAVTGGHSSITQGVIILSMNYFSTIYYVIHLCKDSCSISYSIVDLNYNDGAGKVIEKNMLLNNTDVRTEKMYAVRHANGRDWWLVIFGYPLDGIGTPFKFVKYLLTPFGFNSVEYQYAALLEEGDDFAPLGQMKFSQDGSKMICTRDDNLDIYDFDRCSGEFSNLITIDSVDEKWIYGAEFSPDGDKIYVASGDYPPGQKRIYQFCISCSPDISSTKQIIYDPAYSGERFSQMQRASNGKIYIITWDYNDPFSYSEMNTKLSVINQPNNEGLACDFDTASINTGGKRCIFGLPNMINYSLGALAGSPCDTLNSDTTIAIQNNESGGGVTIYPNPAGNSIILQSAIPLSGIVYIYDVNGVEVFATKIKQEKTNVIDVSLLARGLYTVKIVSEGNENKTAKFVKQ